MEWPPGDARDSLTGGAGSSIRAVEESLGEVGSLFLGQVTAQGGETQGQGIPNGWVCDSLSSKFSGGQD